MTDIVNVAVSDSGKTLHLTGTFSLLRKIEEETDTWAHWKDRQLRMPASRMAYKALSRTLSPDQLITTEAVKAIFSEYKNLEKTALDTLYDKAQPVAAIEGYIFGGQYVPYEHQKKAFSLSRDKKGFALFMEMGTGKTRIIIDEAADLYERGLIDMCLVVAYPSGVPSQWIHEAIPTHMPDRIKVKTWVRHPGRKVPNDIWEPFKGLKFYGLNVEQLQVKSGVKLLNDIIESVPDKRVLLVFDESTSLKSHRSNRSKAGWALAKKANYRRILTGTPITQGMHDLYSQFKLIDPDIIGATSFTAFRNRYCRMGGYERQEIIGYRNVEELMELIHGYSFRVRKEDCLDLPPKVFVRKEIDMTPEQKSLYDKMKKDYFIKLENGEILDGTIGAVRIMRMQQTMSGHIPIIENEKTVGWEPIRNKRIEMTKHILSGVDGKTIIFCKFTPDVEQLVQELSDSCLEYSGRINHTKRHDVLKEFKDNPQKKVLVSQIRAGAMGLDMWYAQNVIYFSCDWSYELHYQSQDRIHRSGQTKTCTYFTILIPNTVDTMIQDIIQNKHDFAKMCLDKEYLQRVL